MCVCVVCVCGVTYPPLNHPTMSTTITRAVCVFVCVCLCVLCVCVCVCVCVVSIGVHLPHTPPPHPKIQSCARGPAGPTNVAKSSIDSGATHRNRPFRPNSPFPWFFLACKTVSAALEPHLPPPFSPGIPPKSGSKRRLLPGKRRLLGGKCGSK